MVLTAALGIGGISALLSSAYIVDEGRVGVLTYMGKAVSQEGPAGLKWKTPFVQGMQEFDVRERALTGELGAATSNQLMTTVTFSVNWRPDPAHILDIFVKYGSPEDFAMNTIRPRLQQSLKSTIGKFTGADMTRRREEVAAAMLDRAQEVLEGYPAILTSVQIEDFSLPPRYMEAVLQKEEQREITEKEQLLLEQQKVQAQQAVQTAEAEKNATKATADGDAYAVSVAAVAEAEAIRLKAMAEADGVRAVAAAIASNPLLVEYERVKSWDGKLPAMVMGDQPSLLMQMPVE
jgi:regulator of protease activity HflC (stomatin/prohibitin superfamily)